MIHLTKEYIASLKRDYYSHINSTYKILLRGEFKESDTSQHFENSINGTDDILDKFNEIIKAAALNCTIILYDECIIYKMTNEGNENASNDSDETFRDCVELTVTYGKYNSTMLEINDQIYNLSQETNLKAIDLYETYIETKEKYKDLLSVLDLKIRGCRDRIGIYVGYLTNEIVLYEMPHNNFNKTDFFELGRSTLDNYKEFIEFIKKEYSFMCNQFECS